ncbi:histone H1.2 isoform X2 [Aplysia californica]|uniref:Histone 1.1 n=1 Tax=Aplysia californica TaxID=6500 RepID=I1SKI8_APLCA|nr:histone H1.2-like [Aplysia californica]XP_005108488.1 histone H1.2-like [Aplysia californica]XP_012943581.1 histone H1.2 isoform X2 [Aplysia californica]ABW86951.1 histone 1.1 [Aplysia californica]
MSDAPAAVAQTKTTPAKKRAQGKPKAPPAHPQYKIMVVAAISSLKERGGSSRQAILKYIIANYKVGDNPTAINARLKTALRAGVKAETLKQSKGTGAAGSFRLGEKSVEKKKPKKDKKPKDKKKSPKKTVKPKKAPGTKKTPTKSKKTGDVKKVTKKATGAKTKKATTKSPGKKNSPAKKSTAAKKVAKKAAPKTTKPKKAAATKK